MQIEIPDDEAELVIKLLRAGYGKIAAQQYVLTRHGRSDVDHEFKNRAMRCVAQISAQIALGLGKD